MKSKQLLQHDFPSQGVLANVGEGGRIFLESFKKLWGRVGNTVVAPIAAKRHATLPS